MLRLLLLSLLFLVINAYAADDERVIKEMMRRTSQGNLTESEIRANYKTGCGGNTFTMRICASFNFIAADVDLNDLYQQLLKKESIATSPEKLRKAQRAWLQFRDLTCEYESNAWSGGGEGMIYSACRERLTKERISKFQEYLNCTESGCP